MSTDRDPTRIVLSWLHSDEYVSADRLLDDVLATVDTTPQRRTSSWFARRFPFMNNNIVRYGLTAAAVVLVAIVGINLFGPNLGGPPDPTPSPTPQATSTPAATAAGPQTLPREIGRTLTAGVYSLARFPVGITLEIPAVDVPAEWRACSESDDEQGVCYWPTGADTAGQLAFLIVDNVVVDPCDPAWEDSTGALLDPPVGPSVDDLVTAMTNLPGFEATTPVDYNLDGFQGRQFTLTAGTDCGGYAGWATASRTTAVGPGSVNRVHVLDVDGVRVVITIDYAPDHLADFQDVLNSVQIEP